MTILLDSYPLVESHSVYDGVNGVIFILKLKINIKVRISRI